MEQNPSEKLTVTQTNSLCFMEHEGTLLCSQEPTLCNVW